jgi:hypothetical protein
MLSRISQAAAFIPLIGYALLWSEKFKEHLELHEALSGGMWFNTTERLLLIYLGAILLTMSWVLFSLFCPKIIKNNVSADDYVFKALQTSTDLYVQNVCEYILKVSIVKGTGNKEKVAQWTKNYEITPLIHLDPHRFSHDIKYVLRNFSTRNSVNLNPKISIALYAYYNVLDCKRLTALGFSVIFFIVGVAIISIPSIDVFVSVIVKIFFPMVGI